jgi:hypothetical protein
MATATAMAHAAESVTLASLRGSSWMLRWSERDVSLQARLTHSHTLTEAQGGSGWAAAAASVHAQAAPAKYGPEQEYFAIEFLAVLPC